MPSFGITSESGTLKRVLVHHPGKELELANTDPGEHHFERPMDIEQFREDHKMIMDALSPQCFDDNIPASHLSQSERRNYIVKG